MDIKTIDMDKLTLTEVFKSGDSLYVIRENENGTYEMNRLLTDDKGFTRDIFGNGDCAIVMLGNKSTESRKEATKVNREPPTKRRGQLTYKYNGPFPKGRIEFRPENSGIRISFYDKKDAEEYFDYFREQFYTRDIPAISISSIYKDLAVVNYNSTECDKWGYPTLDGGKCKYMPEYVTKTRGPKTMYGFTLKRPVIIHGMEESKWYIKRREGLVANGSENLQS